MQNLTFTSYDTYMKLRPVTRPDRGIIETRKVRKVKKQIL